MISMKSVTSSSAQPQTSSLWKTATRLFPILGSCVALSVAAQSQADVAATLGAKKLENANFEQKLNAQLPLDLTFVDENDKPVNLGDFFNRGRPVILTLNYYGCPMLCTMILNGFVDTAKKLPFQIGREYEVVTVSFDPRDTASLAAKKKESYLGTLGQKDAAPGWHFLTGKKKEIDQLCSTVGFSYFFDEKTQEFGHGSGIMVATPQGKLSHYFYGIQYDASDVRLSLVEASQGKIGTLADKAKLIFCFHYDPVSGKYTTAVDKIIKTGCIGTTVIVGASLLIAFRREHRPARKAAA